MLLRSAFVGLALFVSPIFAAFGVTVSGHSVTVDTNGGLVFIVNSSNGDVTSLKFQGVEAQDPSRRSQIGSGLGSTSCSYQQTGDNNNYIVISCSTATLTQYYVAQNGCPAIHMATFTTEEPIIGELRFIARLKKSVLPNGNPASEVDGGTVIEGKDVFLVDGQTRSKFYSGKQFIDDQVHGVSGTSIAAWMIIPENGYEASSGGPFFRDINNQGTAQQELYFYMNSGHTQTEADRQGLHGPYALWFTTGETPSTFDTSFWDGLGVLGWVPASQRGFVQGTANNIPSSYSDKMVILWNNPDAQNWARVQSNGSFTSPPMKPGTYTQTLYKGELAVGSVSSVTVGQGSTVTADISDTYDGDNNVIWQLGDFDGTPGGFLNADLIGTAHPSDTRMQPWVVNYTIGQQINEFPMAVFQDVGPVLINFELSSSQIGARTLKIATTYAFAGGRPRVTVNSWEGPWFDGPELAYGRGITRGTYRAFNHEYLFDIPSGVLVDGSNTIVIGVLSGSGGTPQFLSPNFAFDALSLA